MKNKFKPFGSLWLAILQLLGLVTGYFRIIRRALSQWRLDDFCRAARDSFSRDTRNLLRHLNASLLRRGGLSSLFMLLFCVALLGAPRASAQTTALNNFPLTNMPPTLGSNVVYYMTNVVQLTKNCGLSVAGRTTATITGGNEVLYGSFSNDNTNFGINPFTMTAANSTLVPQFPTNTLTAYTNFAQAALSGLTAVNFYLVTNNGAGVVTNTGWVANRPTLNVNTF